MAQSFIVCIHDVCSSTRAETEEIVALVSPYIGRAVSIAVIPSVANRSPIPNGLAELRPLAHGVSEVLLHGWCHRRGWNWSPLSHLTGRCDEFARLSLQDATSRLGVGRRLLQQELDVPIRGCVPPAWRPGQTAKALAPAGLEFMAGMTRLCHVDRSDIPLATYSWDPGPIGALGYALHAAGFLFSLQSSAVPVIAIHPVDLRRGYFRLARSLISRFLAAGSEPTVFSELARTAGAAGAVTS